MADYRYVHTKIWRDDWFFDLPLDGKILWIYLFTNLSSSVSGIYKLPDRFIAFDTGLKVERVVELKQKFRQDGKIDFEGDVIWVKKMREMQAGNSPKIIACIKKDVQGIPDCNIRKTYIEKYHMDIVPISYPTRRDETKRDESETKRDETGAHGAQPPETSSGGETSTATPAGHSATNTRKADLPEAVQVFLANGGKLPTGKLGDGTRKADKAIELITAQVRATPEELDFWGKVVQAYCLTWSGKSYTVMLNDYYLRRRIPGKNGGSDHPKPAYEIVDEALRKLEAQDGNQ